MRLALDHRIDDEGTSINWNVRQESLEQIIEDVGENVHRREREKETKDPSVLFRKRFSWLHGVLLPGSISPESGTFLGISCFASTALRGFRFPRSCRCRDKQSDHKSASKPVGER